MGLKLNYFLLLASLFLCSCDKSDDPVLKNKRQVYLLFSPSGVGDMGYNDLILRGALEAEEESDFDLYILQPSSMEEAERFFFNWLQKENKEGVYSLFVLAANDYELLVRKNISTDIAVRKEILLFESRAKDLDVATFRISMYGACYLAGCVAAQFANQAAVMCGNGIDVIVNQAAEGFLAGFMESGGVKTHRINLADNWQGYAMPGVAYEKTDESAKTYPFIFPIAGGSNLGVYRYTREYPKGIYTAGMDVDQSGFSSQITFSVVKYIDRILKSYIKQWIGDSSLPHTKVFGLESGYIDIVPSSNYVDMCSPVLQNSKGKAISKEQEYEKGN